MRFAMNPKILACIIAAFAVVTVVAAYQEASNAEAKRIGHPNDSAARSFLREAEERGASWNGFPGFKGDIKVYRDGRTHQGEVTVGPDGKVRVELGDADARKWVAAVMTSIASTSNRRNFEDRYDNVGVVFGKDDLHPLGMLVELRGDPYQSRFRILDKEIRVIERTTKDEKILLHIVSIERDSKDRKRARSFVVYYFDKKSGDLLRSEAIRDERTTLEGYVLPELWTETSVAKGDASTNSLTILNHQLLPEAPSPSAKRRTR